MGGGLLLAILLLNRLIRSSLAAPRIVENSVPEGLPWQEVSIPTVRSKKLFGWLIPAGEMAPAIVILHGWGGNAEMMLPLAGPLHAAGYTVLMIDARSHGRSDVDTFSSLPRFAEDLAEATAWLRRQPDIDPPRIGVIGHSVGAAACLLYASRQPDLAAVVSIAAFSHPAAMMRRWLKFRRIPYWPLGAYILFYVQQVIGQRFDAIAPCHTIRRIACPVLLAHGGADAMVPVSEAHEIFARRPDERVELLLMPGSHDQYDEIERHMASLIGFLDAAMPPARRFT
ncbi:MAG: prolyl oligopeptidase family protein [Proteobacteria bacterium]|nr:prolyl oligopeptidase family protein [Pseudomonadota bacterium]